MPRSNPFWVYPTLGLDLWASPRNGKLVTKSVFSPQYDRLRKMLVESRKAAGLTQEALAERLKRIQSFVSKYERGERRLDVIEFLEVANAVGVDPHAFIRKLTGEVEAARSATPKTKDGRR